MPVHDWTRVDAGVFHDFHSVWIAELRNALNRGLLPPDYYAMAEQHANKYVADVLTLHPAPVGERVPTETPRGGIAVAEAPPKVRWNLSLTPSVRTRRKTLAIRHVSGHRLIALIEIVSPANKDRKEHVQELVAKLTDALLHGIHVLLIDLFPPGAHDRHGIHGAVWKVLGDAPTPVPRGEPLTLASYEATTTIEVFMERVAVGSTLMDMPLFLEPDLYVNVPLESTYDSTWRGTPAFWRETLEARPRNQRRKSR